MVRLNLTYSRRSKGARDNEQPSYVVVGFYKAHWPACQHIIQALEENQYAGCLPYWTDDAKTVVRSVSKPVFQRAMLTMTTFQVWYLGTLLIELASALRAA
jgi:hypothetical protein